MADVSILIRCKNEELCLDAVLSAVRHQQLDDDVELVVVDNRSTDRSRAIAEAKADIVVDCFNFRPGLALNLAVAASSGEQLVALSAHAIPADRAWLTTLLTAQRAGADDRIGTYGAQIYQIEAEFLDQRDLDIFSDPVPRCERADSDFWNANSTFTRARWDALPFDEQVIELEDHYWTKQQLPCDDHHVYFEPEAMVYHYGHEQRNDRQFLAEDGRTTDERMTAARRTLESWPDSWPDVMDAGMTIGSLWREPAAADAAPILADYLCDHWDFDVRWRMAGALGRIRADASVPALAAGLDDPSFYVRDECAWSLARHGRSSVAAVVAAVPTIDPVGLPFAALALGLTDDDDAREVAASLFEQCLSDQDPSLELNASYFVGETTVADNAPSLTHHLLKRLAAEDLRVRRGATWSWGKQAARDDAVAEQGLPVVVDAARHAAPPVIRAESTITLGRLARSAHDHDLQRMLADILGRDPAGPVRFAAVQSLRYQAEAGDERATAFVADAADPEDPDFGVRFERALALGARLGSVS